MGSASAPERLYSRGGDLPFRIGALASILAAGLAGGCGAKTGLLLPDADVVVDADVFPDVPPDGCVPERVGIQLRRGQVIFVIDRSWSMSWNLEGGVAGPGERTRWQLLHDSLGEVLPSAEALLEMGAKFYPIEMDEIPDVPDDMACAVSSGIDLVPEPNNTEEILDVFARTIPMGGTPTAVALSEAGGHYALSPAPGVARFIVLTTDGGPNCNPAVWNPATGCICTGTPDYCAEPADAEFNCLDDERTLNVIRAISNEQGIPIFVIGIDDPFRPDLADFLDQMALIGGRPRTDPGERLFYSVRREGDLTEALDSITSTIARCVFTVGGRLGLEQTLEVQVDGEVIPRDPSQVGGWDWTDRDARELTFFGRACERASADGARVRGFIMCDL